jgi:Fe-S oxidoreductase
MTRADDVVRGAHTIDAATAEVWQHCTGCGRCTQICKHDNPVAEALYAARAAAVEAGHDALSEWADAPRPACSAFEALPVGGAVQLLPGFAPSDQVEAALTVLRACGLTVGRPAHAIFTAGTRWREAGRPSKADEALRSAQAALQSTQTVVCLDADDVRALRPAVEAVGLLDWIATRLPAQSTVLEGDVLYLDACRSGRGLAQYDLPRTLLSALVGGTIVEATLNREEGGCCGAGAGYAHLHPTAAGEVAREFAADAASLPVVIAQAGCAAHLKAALAPRPVYALSELIAQATQGES